MRHLLELADKSPERLNSRNGCRERQWAARAGSIALKISKLRQGSYFPDYLEPRRTAEKALTAVIIRRVAVYASRQNRPARPQSCIRIK